MAAQWVVSLAGVALYLAALVLPTYSPFNVQFSNATYAGADAFRIGWQAMRAFEPREIDFWILSAAWLANPAIWVGIIAAACGRWRITAVAAGCGLVLSLTVLLRLGGMVAKHPGVWVWSGSALVLLVGSSIVWWRLPRQTKR